MRRAYSSTVRSKADTRFSRNRNCHDVLAAIQMDSGSCAANAASLVFLRLPDAVVLRGDSQSPFELPMFCDCDDLVHRGLASFCEKHADQPGWYVDAGYVYWEGSGRAVPVRSFHQICGTSFVIAWDLLGVPGDVGPNDDPADIRRAWEEERFTGVLGRHQTMLGYFRGRGVDLAPLPFPGAIWVRGTGENVSRFGGFASISGQPVDGAIERDFSFEAPAVNLWRDAARAAPQIISGIAPLIRKFGAAWFLRHYVVAMPRRIVNAIRGKPWGS